MTVHFIDNITGERSVHRNVFEGMSDIESQLRAAGMKNIRVARGGAGVVATWKSRGYVTASTQYRIQVI